MNPGQIARVLHEVSRAQNQGGGLIQWESESPVYREALTRFTGRLLSGEIQPEQCFANDPVRIAIVRACKAPVFDLNAETGIEPERKPGYRPKDLEREAPATRALKAPGECVVQTFV